MVQNNNNNNITIQDTKDTKKHKNQLKKKCTIYFILILILIVSGILLYMNFSKYFNKSFNDESSLSKSLNDTVNTEYSDSEDYKNNTKYSKELNRLLEKNILFQEQINDKIASIEQEIKSNKDVYEHANEKILFLNKINNLEQQINLLNNKKDYIKNFTIVYNFILALNSNAPFLLEYNSFLDTSLAKKFNQEIMSLKQISTKGIPNNYDLVYFFDDLFPKIKTAVYSLDKSAWGRFKYYISYLFVIQHDTQRSTEKQSIDIICYNIKKALIDNLPEKALALVESNNLHKLQVLAPWYINLNYRVQANMLSAKLQQYLLSSTSGNK